MAVLSGQIEFINVFQFLDLAERWIVFVMSVMLVTLYQVIKSLELSQNSRFTP